MSVNQEFVVWRRLDVIILDELCEREQILEQINELNFPCDSQNVTHKMWRTVETPEE